MIIVVLVAALPAAAQEWTRFRGPNGSGIAGKANIAVKWSEKEYHWKVKLPERGYSSPVLWGKKIFLTCAEKKTAKRIIEEEGVREGAALIVTTITALVIAILRRR